MTSHVTRIYHPVSNPLYVVSIIYGKRVNDSLVKKKEEEILEGSSSLICSYKPWCILKLDCITCGTYARVRVQSYARERMPVCHWSFGSNFVVKILVRTS